MVDPRDVPVRFSHLKAFAKSAAHYRAAVQAGRPDSPTFRNGRLVHALILGGMDAFAVYEGERRGNAWKDFAAAQHEVPVNWTNLGRACSSRIDVIGRRWVTELKTSVDSSPWRFPHLAVRLGYHAQLSWYQHAARFMGRQDVDAAHIVAVEPVPPYAVTKFNLTPSALLEGEKMWRGWMERLLVCEAANVWPAYSEASVDLDVPGEGDDALTVDGEELVF
jgi:hypothetical protein